ncbi:MAG: hypothetical protein CVU51_08745 [Deltaproteobacteria bacterium HGW-Deltaproteobacteria-1]|nr:MAG: hypothetical protein CVU51_08745 [Deltaproteobacteria bacterium HGW-Deltaproteobacteria-1]
MLNIEQFRYGDNLAYLLYGRTEAMAIDGGAWQEILAFLEENHLILKYVTNTHRHYDHTPGDDHLLGKTKARFLDCTTLADNETIHDYVKDSLAFAEHMEPQNKDIEHFRQSCDPDFLYSTLAEERRINPYLRFNEEPILKLIKDKGLPHATGWERWQSLMAIE